MNQVIKGFVKSIIIDAISLVVTSSILLSVMTNHVSDGNTFAIYIKDSHLFIGDFWAGLIVVCSFVFSILITVNLIRTIKGLIICIDSE